MTGWDHRFENWIVAHRVASLDPVAKGLSTIGAQGAIWLAIAALLALASKRIGVLIWVAFADLLAQVATVLIKDAFPRARPHVLALVREPSSPSFPSGHAVSSFACAVVLAAYFPQVKALFYVLAALIASSRAYVGVHYPLDVLAGALFGLVLGAATLGLRAATTGRRRSSSESRGTPSARQRS